MECRHGASPNRDETALFVKKVFGQIETELGEGKSRVSTGNTVATIIMEEDASLVDESMLAVLASEGTQRLLRREQQKHEKAGGKIGKCDKHDKEHHVSFACTLTQVIVNLESQVLGSPLLFAPEIKSESELVAFFQSRIPCNCLDRYSQELKQKKNKKRPSLQQKSKSMSSVKAKENDEENSSNKSNSLPTKGKSNSSRNITKPTAEHTAQHKQSKTKDSRPNAPSRSTSMTGVKEPRTKPMAPARSTTMFSITRPGSAEPAGRPKTPSRSTSMTLRPRTPSRSMTMTNRPKTPLRSSQMNANLQTTEVENRPKTLSRSSSMTASRPKTPSRSTSMNSKISTTNTEGRPKTPSMSISMRATASRPKTPSRSISMNAKDPTTKLESRPRTPSRSISMTAVTRPKTPSKSEYMDLQVPDMDSTKQTETKSRAPSRPASTREGVGKTSSESRRKTPSRSMSCELFHLQEDVQKMDTKTAELERSSIHKDKSKGNVSKAKAISVVPSTDPKKEGTRVKQAKPKAELGRMKAEDKALQVEAVHNNPLGDNPKKEANSMDNTPLKSSSNHKKSNVVGAKTVDAARNPSIQEKKMEGELSGNTAIPKASSGEKSNKDASKREHAALQPQPKHSKGCESVVEVANVKASKIRAKNAIKTEGGQVKPPSEQPIKPEDMGPEAGAIYAAPLKETPKKDAILAENPQSGKAESTKVTTSGEEEKKSDENASNPKKNVNKMEKALPDPEDPTSEEVKEELDPHVTKVKSFQITPEEKKKISGGRVAKSKAVHIAPHMNRMTKCSARDCGIYRPLFNFTACAGCQSVFYCNTTCQRKDWKYHSADCASMKKAKENA